MLTSYKKYFSQSLMAHKGKIMMQGHSHHLWPDHTIHAHQRAGQLAVTQSDDKWGIVMDEVIPQAQQLISKMLGLSHRDICFAPNTHELLARLTETLIWNKYRSQQKPLKVTITDREFYSARRQMLSYAQARQIELSTTPVQELLKQPCQRSDIIFFSQCFFDNGEFLSEQKIEQWLDQLHSDTVVIVDLYHSFATRLLTMRKINQRCYLLGGCYKYAMSGEGCCFLIPPQSDNHYINPINTGWFAEFALLSKKVSDHLTVQYPESAQRFTGATFDPSGIIRFADTWRGWEDFSISVSDIHQHVIQLQKHFMDNLCDHKFFQDATWQLPQDFNLASKPWGHFFSLQYSSNEQAQDHFAQLKSKEIYTDMRENRIRFGFSPYIDTTDLDDLQSRL